MSPITHQTLSPTSTLGQQPKNICLFSGNFRFLQSFPFQHPSISLSALMSSYWSSHQHNNKLSPSEQSVFQRVNPLKVNWNSPSWSFPRRFFAIYMTTKILLMSKMMTISLIVYCVCEEKVVNISYSHKHWRDIKQGAHNDQTFLHHVKESAQSYTMLNGQTFLLLYLGHLIVNFPYSYFYFRPPSPAPAFILLTSIHLFWEYIFANINLVQFKIILMRHTSPREEST